MRARIIAAVVAVLAGALCLASVLSYYLVHRAAIENSRAAVLRDAQTMRRSIDADEKLLFNGRVFALVGHTAGVSVSAVLVSSTGTVISVEPPLQVPTSRIDGHRLAAGKDLAAVVGSQAFAVVPLASASASDLGTVGASGITVALALEHPIAASSDSLYYFILGGGIALVFAAAVIWVIARRITRRVLAASAAARRIAAGDLEARVERGGHAYPELAGLDNAIDTMAENLARARDQERQFLLSISHDLRTPLTSIRGYAEAIREGAVADTERAAAVVVAEATRLERLIRDLLDLARLEARQFALNAGPCDLATTVQEATDALRVAHAASGVRLTVQTPPAPFPVVADADRFAQVLSNVVENALKFATSAVEVTLEDLGAEGIALSVLDDGPGIDPEDLPHVFERLFTSSRHAARAAGSGLGLAIVSELTAAMGGIIDVVSPVDGRGGTRLSVHLPLVHLPGTDERAPYPAASASR